MFFYDCSPSLKHAFFGWPGRALQTRGRTNCLTDEQAVKGDYLFRCLNDRSCQRYKKPQCVLDFLSYDNLLVQTHIFAQFLRQFCV